MLLLGYLMAELMEQVLEQGGILRDGSLPGQFDYYLLVGQVTRLQTDVPVDLGVVSRRHLVHFRVCPDRRRLGG